MYCASPAVESAPYPNSDVVHKQKYNIPLVFWKPFHINDQDKGKDQLNAVDYNT